ncbi:NAD dehydrogenase [Hysterangium stoloniferum]|nr:NAD dehydrogenase [Hysterangium stoloniferum]
MIIRGLAAALNASGRYKYKPPESTVDHLIIGGGVIGLAIAARLCAVYPTKSTYLVERHSRAGEEISSRNSEVIHAGIYYPPQSLKADLCIQGRRLLYERCSARNIPHKAVGKLVVAGPHQRGYLNQLVERMKIISTHNGMTPVPLELISGAEAREMQPDLSPDIELALHSPQTGIIDSHALIESFEQDIGESEGGELVYSTKVVRIDPYTLLASGDGEKAEGWVVQTVTSQGTSGDFDGESDAFLAKVLINASGLNGHLVLNSLLPPERAIPMYYARGSYASYRGPGVGQISKLIYPVPELTSNKVGSSDPSSFQSLGTHLTLDLDGNIRFGPDIEWLTPPLPKTTSISEDGYVVDEEAIDFWASYLAADDNAVHLETIHRAITTYLPNVLVAGLKPDYVGIRPKLVPPKGGFQDFQIRCDSTFNFGGSGNSPMISLLGIESPGLTSCLAIADLVVCRLSELQEGK